MTDDHDNAGASWFSEDAATFGDRMAGAREVLAMSQADLALSIGVKLKTIRAWEDDLSEPRANRLQMLAGILNVSIMWLLNGEGDGLDAPATGNELAPDLSQILSGMRQLSTEASRISKQISQLEKRLRIALSNGD
jgi:transcriptional regulator with XRE-family HTH domain